MKTAKEIRDLMPSVIERKNYLNNRLNEIENLIIDTAKHNKGEIVIWLKAYEEEFIIEQLKLSGYYIFYTGTIEWNDTVYRKKYIIKWG